jgi:hypothetical protein
VLFHLARHAGHLDIVGEIVDAPTRCASTGLTRGVPSLRIVPANTNPQRSSTSRPRAATSGAAASSSPQDNPDPATPASCASFS